eukprot:TRINITY_DN72340_c0_g1_i1.p1 TRINITY_DN72340_c0_g1~~TRINITY_DN72340_c0_g1_i1.p1  ORF type:complete len:641 (+),score=113.13 TRINITY_DN72340_c0_g1_i1:96-2018(+)
MEAGTLRSVKDGLCAQCYSKASVKCAKCKITWYCSGECQAKDWLLGHKGDCGLQDLPPPVVPQPPPRLQAESVENPVVSCAAWRKIGEVVDAPRNGQPLPYPRGLLNIGNTCYMNSTLQGLYHAAPQLMCAFREHCKKESRTCTPESCFRCALEDLDSKALQPLPVEDEEWSDGSIAVGDIVSLRDLSRADLNGQEGVVIQPAQGNGDDDSLRCGVRLRGEMGTKAIRPSNLSLRCRAPVGPRQMARWIPRLSEEFTFGAQEDAHEFLRSVLRLVEDEELKEHAEVFAKSTGSKQLPEPHADLTTSPNRTFRGLLVSTCTCTNRSCGNCSSSFESFMDLCLDITEATDSVEDCFRLFVAPERLDKKNGWTCEVCKQTVRARKQLTIYQAPSVLVVQLKRFRAVMGGLDRGKVTKPVSFKTDLNLRPYVCIGSPEANKPLLYELRAVIVHLDKAGFSHFGHYIAYVRVAGGNGLSKWYLLDDSQVTEVPEAEVLKQQAYLLMYAVKGGISSEASTSAPKAAPRGSSKEGGSPASSADAGVASAQPSRCRGRNGSACTFFAAADGLCTRCYQDEHGRAPPPRAAAKPAAPTPSQPQEQRRQPQAPSRQPAAAASGAKPKKVGANDPCPCGSGKKYKKCHGAA